MQESRVKISGTKIGNSDQEKQTGREQGTRAT
jgi:hypothetical protein